MKLHQRHVYIVLQRFLKLECPAASSGPSLHYTPYSEWPLAPLTLAWRFIQTWNFKKAVKINFVIYLQYFRIRNNLVFFVVKLASACLDSGVCSDICLLEKSSAHLPVVIPPRLPGSSPDARQSAIGPLAPQVTDLTITIGWYNSAHVYFRNMLPLKLLCSNPGNILQFGPFRDIHMENIWVKTCSNKSFFKMESVT